MTARLLLANPNTSAHITARMADIARRIAGDRAEIVTATAPFGSPALETEEQLRTAEIAVKIMLHAHRHCDGALIAAFGDPGLSAARRSCSRPVHGLGEAGLIAAGRDRRRFSIITLGARLVPAIRAKASALGLGPQLAGIDILDCSVLEFAENPDLYIHHILGMAEDMKVDGGADAVLLGGAPFAGITETLADQTSISLVDGLSAGIEQLLNAIEQAT
jgi:Asp/Glu/hydantoin racemase